MIPVLEIRMRMPRLRTFDGSVFYYLEYYITLSCVVKPIGARGGGITLFSEIVLIIMLRHE